jgi:hypothetical protein
MYQKKNTHLNETIKVILTNNKYAGNTNAQFLSYFNTTFNTHIEPGDLIWPPTAGGAFYHPWRSIQIFADYMDDAILLSKFESVPDTTYGSNLTSAVYHVTTLDNPAFGVQGGQRVYILLLQTNNPIPSALLSPRSIFENSIPLANMAFDIMSSTVLLDRIKEFISS